MTSYHAATRVSRSLSAVVAVFGVLALTSAALADDLFTSLQQPPTRAEVAEALKRGVRVFDFDLDQDGAKEAVTAIKKGGAKITAYHVGGGGGRAWGSKKNDEQVRKYDMPESFSQLTADVKRLVAKGADYIHFDNTHRMSGKRLEAVADAIRAGGAGFIAKNNAPKWSLVMKRRPDLVPAYAVIENGIFDNDETRAAYQLHAKGVPVYMIGFRKLLSDKDQPVTEEDARQFRRNNPWAKVLLMADEAAYDGRTGGFVN